MRKVSKILYVMVLLMVLYACEQIPSYIIHPDAMADLLVDVHKSESISENIKEYGTPERKEQMRRSIFEKHGITQAQFDTSLVWYSDHMKKYSQVYDVVTARLRAESDKVKTLLVEKKSAPLSRPGDSINVWNKEPFFLFEPRLHRHILTFEILADDNYREDDIFQLSVSFDKLPVNTPDKARVTLIIKHRNDSITTSSTEVLQDGRIMVEAQAKNLKVSRIMGSIEVPAHPSWQSTYTKDISLLRIRHKQRPNRPRP